MPTLRPPFAVAAFILAALLHLTVVPAFAQQVPLDVGTVAAGYQDDFNGASLNPSWTVRGASVYSVSGGMLHVTSGSGDPNHLLYELAGYNNTVQEVLVRIRVTNFGSADGPRGGIATCVDAATSQGIDLHFRDEPSLGQRHMEFLDDSRAWGTEYSIVWQNNIWYWLRLRHEPNAASQGGVNDVFGKIWLADGSQAEPAAWQVTLDYTPSRSTRTGFAGIAASSLGGLSEYDVDYVLIKASGLPNITVAPNAFVQTPVTLTNQPQSQTVVELSSATFSVSANGNPAPTYQWYKDGNALGNATNASYAINPVQLTNAGNYHVIAMNVVSNITYSATSSVATLTVVPDNGPPHLRGVQSIGLTQVQVSFDERLSPATATNAANYTITNATESIIVSNITIDVSQSNVVLTVSQMTEGAVYTITINNVVDQSAAQNPIIPNTHTNFTALSYATQDIGNPSPGGSRVQVGNGFDISGGGTDIGGTSDQFQFTWQQRTGDFDVKVRLASLGLSDAWAEAGLMARETLAVGSRFASAMGTPSISGCYFQSRGAANGASGLSGSFPANYPNTWLRLQRIGNVFTGYAGYDGQSWTALGNITIAMPAAIYLGFAVSSHNTNQTTTAAFRDISSVTSTTTNALPISVEPLSQSSRLTSLVISEIMYNPAPRIDNRHLEFVELFNALGEPQDISSYRLSGEVEFTFPPNTVLPGGGFLVVARVPADLQAIYGISGVLGPFSNTNNLSNKAGVIRLRHRTGAVLLEAKYDSDPPYPLSADGAGHSLVLARPSYGEGNPLAWSASDSVDGSPGRLDAVTLDPMRSVVINEFLAHTDLPDFDYVELYNHANDPMDISGCFLSDNPGTNKFTVPPGTVIPPRGFVVFYETNLNFALSSHGEEIYFRNPANTRVIDAVRFGAQENGVSTGRSPDGAENFYRMSAKTPGASNSPARISDVVINEIMFNPISGDSADEFVELYNRGTNIIDLYRWKLDGGISHTFKRGTMLPPDSYLVVANNITNLLAKYSNLHSNNTVGNYGGSLGNSSDRVALSMPDFETSTNALGQLVTNNVDIVVNEVIYHDGGRWGQWADGGGSSLELIDARADTRRAANWADSDETAKAPWTFVSFTGTLDNGNVAADQLQVLLQGAGECLMDNIEVLNSSTNNLIANPGFETDAGGWTAEGTEANSGLESTSGYNSSKSYHIRAVDRGDNQINRVRTPLTSALSSGATATIRAKVRWLLGHPEILFRLRGNWLEAVGTMALPSNLGTPGARNSRAVTNAPPAIYDVAHSPVLPPANQPCVVTARVSDPNQPVSIVLKYRLDPSVTYTTATMVDDGTAGDAIAGDGIFSATILGQPAATMVAFYVQASDAFSAASTFPNNAPTRECLVRFGELQPTGNFPVYRIWMTQATLTSWAGLSATPYRNLNNAPFNVVFVLGDRRAIYNSLAVYAGSPYIGPGYSSPAAGRCGYSIAFPSDDLFLGNSDLVLDWPGGHGGENTALQEQMAYWIADRLNLPFSHRYTIRLHVNGVTDVQRSTVFEAVNQPASDFINAWSPDDTGGDFYKIDRGFEFNDAGGLTADPQPRLEIYNTTGGVKKQARYRWNWNKRAADRSNNYTNIFALVDAVNGAAYDPYTSQTEGLVDTEEWMGIFATEHIIVNFDAYGHEIGKNMYAYKPEHGKWQLYMFDLDWLMLAAPGHVASYVASTAPLFNSEDPTIARMFNHPPFRRAYFRAIQDAVNGPLISGNCNPVMDAKYASLVANGVQFCDGQALANPSLVKTWFSDRRTALVAQLAAIASPFTVSATNVTVNSNVVTISGTAQINIKTIEFNGVPYSLTWTTISNWTARFPVNTASNLITILGYDHNGVFVSGASNRVTASFTGSVEPAVGNIVINELMFRGLAENSEYIEFYNKATNTTFDLSNWRVNGLGYTFPEGSVIAARTFLLLAKNRSVFSVQYGGSIPVFGEFDGDLQSDGETISLIAPGDVIVDRVRYEGALPWPAAEASGTGSSYQLIDVNQDNSRAGNWFANFIPAIYTPTIITPAAPRDGWRFFSASGTLISLTTTQRLAIYLGEAGSAWIDDVSVVNGTNPAVGLNYVRKGDFESTLLDDISVPNRWTLGTNYTNSLIVGDLVHSGSGALKIVGTAPGNANSPFNKMVSQAMDPVFPSLTNTLSFWYWATNSATNLFARIVNSTGITTGLGNGSTNINIFFTPSNFVPAELISPATNALTPGVANQMTTNLAPFEPLWINEVQAENLTGILDNSGEHDPWIEIYNASPNAVSLAGLYLSGNYTNLTNWAFPPASSIGPTQFLVVFCDGQPAQTSGTEYHTSFRLPAASGSVALSRIHSNAPQVIDYVNYAGLHSDRSYGSFPDGQPFDRQEFFFVTPRATNNGSAAPLVVFINEWMAGNVSVLADPADGDFEDWFELYNPGLNAVDLAGYYLTDTLTNKFKYLVTTNGEHIIPPQGYLLVWADNETGQNLSVGVPRADLHVNFALSISGEAIGLFAADGAQIDAVTFGQQTNDVSQGRCPDGSANIILMAASTPRTANNGCSGNNTAPNLAPIGNRIIYLGETLSFHASATDIGSPPQTLTFSLDAGAPVGALINPVTGLFTWTPAQAGTNQITVRVRDNGAPPLNDFETITVIVSLPPAFTGTRRNGNDFEMMWKTRPGRSYRIEYTDDLAHPAWLPLGNDLPAGGDALSVTNSIVVPQRFYRIKLVE